MQRTSKWASKWAPAPFLLVGHPVSFGGERVFVKLIGSKLVYRGTWKGEEVAIKKIAVSQTSEVNAEELSERFQDLRREVMLMRSVYRYPLRVKAENSHIVHNNSEG